MVSGREAHSEDIGKLADVLRTEGRWFGPEDRPLLGWLSTSSGAVTASGVLILPPIGYPYWSSHSTLRALAQRLAGAGHTVLRLDYDGTGDSAGDQSDGDRVAAWRSSAAAGAAELRTLGVRQLILLGVRLGATLALVDGAALGADAVVAWSPVVSGRRYAKEIRLLATPVPDDGAGDTAGSVVAAGTVFSAQTLDELSKLAVIGSDAAPVGRTLVLDAGSDGGLLDHLRGQGGVAEHQALAGGEQALEVPAEEATVPQAIVAAIESWIGPCPSSAGSVAPRSTRAALSWGGGRVTEEIVTLGPDRLVGILTEPGASAAGSSAAAGATVVMLNSGSESHVGPGRAWVEYARGLARLGHSCLRVDFRGWGESPDDGYAPGRPYDAHCIQDTARIIAELRARGHDRIVLLGLCAGAWIALRAALGDQPPAGVIALNPQLYWQPGDPVEALMSTTRSRRTAERERERLGGRYGLWTAADLLGARPWAGRWLDELREVGLPIAMLFAAGDDGLEFLDNRLRRRLRRVRRSAALRVVELPEVDHAMHRTWLRARVIQAIAEQLEQMPGRGSSQRR